MQVDAEALDTERVAEVIEAVADRIGWDFQPHDIVAIIQHTICKCQMNGKDNEYFYLLLEDELQSFLVRAEINAIGQQNLRRHKQCVVIAV